VGLTEQAPFSNKRSSCEERQPDRKMRSKDWRAGAIRYSRRTDAAGAELSERDASDAASSNGGAPSASPDVPSASPDVPSANPDAPSNRDGRRPGDEDDDARSNATPRGDGRIAGRPRATAEPRCQPAPPPRSREEIALCGSCCPPAARAARFQVRSDGTGGRRRAQRQC
jgi:hypothetical protein